MAAADTLPGVTGVALCLYGADHSRVAVGVSDQQALLAEQWEYTIGAGPGLHVQRTGRSTSTGDDFAARWPVFCESLLSNTGFRSVLAVPLANRAGVFSASLLLYYDAIDDARNTDSAEVDEVAEAVGFAVAVSSGELLTLLQPAPRLDFASQVGARMAVDVAIGMVVQAQGLNAGDAFDVLRAHAYSRDETVDHAAERVTSGYVNVKTL